MPKRAPTIEEILTAFEAEAATAVRFASVDRALLQRLIDDHRRLETFEEDALRVFEEMATPTSHSQRESQGRVVGA